MNETVEIHWVPVATIAVGMVAAHAVVTHAVPAVARVALRELDYRACHGDPWALLRR